MLRPRDVTSWLAFGVGGVILVEFNLDLSGRIAAQNLVTPNHLIVRRFSYTSRR